MGIGKNLAKNIEMMIIKWEAKATKTTDLHGVEPMRMGLVRACSRIVE